MNATEYELDAQLRSMLDQHLDAIERVLSESGLSRAERRGVCDEVEAQATEMFWQRVAGGQPSPQLMAAVIAELDDPEAYRDGDAPPATTHGAVNLYPGAKLHPFSLWALLTPILGFMVMFTPLGPKGETYGLIWMGLLVVMSVTFTCIAIRDIRREPSRYYGITRNLFKPISDGIPTAVRVLLWLVLIFSFGLCLFLISAMFYGFTQIS